MIDVHCHLEYMENVEDVINEAKKRMSAVINSVADIKHFSQIYGHAKQNPNFLFVTLGLHPVYCFNYSLQKIDEYIELIRSVRNEIVGIGEVGLDYYYIKGKEKREESKKVFELFINLANELKKPLVIHSRNAIKDTLKMLESAAVDILMHCFYGNHEQISTCVERSYFLSIATIVCKSKPYKQIIPDIPIHLMTLETDSPWLDPKSSQLINRPWKIELSAEIIGKIKNIEKCEILKTTENNAKRLFKL